MSNDTNLVRGPSFPDPEPRRTPAGSDAGRGVTATGADGVPGAAPAGDPGLREWLLALAVMAALTVLPGLLAVLASLVDMPGLAHCLMYCATATFGCGFVVVLVSLARRLAGHRAGPGVSRGGGGRGGGGATG